MTICSRALYRSPLEGEHDRALRGRRGVNRKLSISDLPTPHKGEGISLRRTDTSWP